MFVVSLGLALGMKMSLYWHAPCVGLLHEGHSAAFTRELGQNFGAAKAVVVMAGQFQSAQMIPSWNKAAQRSGQGHRGGDGCRVKVPAISV